MQQLLIYPPYLGTAAALPWENKTASDDRAIQHETPMFIPPDLWLSNSRDLNPVHYRIWDVMQN